MTEWTDLDYAQAAIDMLPGSVEEIEEFLERQGIKSKYNGWRGDSCPIAQHLTRWVGRGVSVGRTRAVMYNPYLVVDLPPAVTYYILYVDKQVS